MQSRGKIAISHLPTSPLPYNTTGQMLSFYRRYSVHQCAMRERRIVYGQWKLLHMSVCLGLHRSHMRRYKKKQLLKFTVGFQLFSSDYTHMAENEFDFFSSFLNLSVFPFLFSLLSSAPLERRGRFLKSSEPGHSGQITSTYLKYVNENSLRIVYLQPRN